MAHRLLPTLLSIGLFLSTGWSTPTFTRDVETRTRRSVPRGVVIEHCTVPRVVALTFDDGPYAYSSQILDLLDKHHAKATFFVNGDNWSNGINDPSSPWPAILKRMLRSGHQIGSHTWSHVDLSTASPSQRRDQVHKLEKVLNRVIGKAPTYLRPPFGSCSRQCLRDIESMGYHVVNFDLDTKDYLYNQPDAIEASKDIFSSALRAGGRRASFLVLSHETLEQTAEALVPYMLEQIRRRGYRAVTVGECLGDPAKNWYQRV